MKGNPWHIATSAITAYHVAEPSPTEYRPLWSESPLSTNSDVFTPLFISGLFILNLPCLTSDVFNVISKTQLGAMPPETCGMVREREKNVDSVHERDEEQARDSC